MALYQTNPISLDVLKRPLSDTQTYLALRYFFVSFLLFSRTTEHSNGKASLGFTQWVAFTTTLAYNCDLFLILYVLCCIKHQFAALSIIFRKVVEDDSENLSLLASIWEVVMMMSILTSGGLYAERPLFPTLLKRKCFHLKQASKSV